MPKQERRSISRPPPKIRPALRCAWLAAAERQLGVSERHLAATTDPVLRVEEAIGAVHEGGEFVFYMRNMGAAAARFRSAQVTPLDITPVEALPGEVRGSPVLESDAGTPTAVSVPRMRAGVRGKVEVAIVYEAVATGARRQTLSVLEWNDAEGRYIVVSQVDG